MILLLVFVLCICVATNAFQNRLLSRFKTSELDFPRLQAAERDIEGSGGLALNDLSLGIGSGGVLVLLVNRLSVDLEKKKVLFPDWSKAKHFTGKLSPPSSPPSSLFSPLSPLLSVS